MTEAWRNGTSDEMEIDLSEIMVVIDRVQDTDAPCGAGMANVTFLGGVVATICDLPPGDLRTLAAALVDFADRLDGDTDGAA